MGRRSGSSSGPVVGLRSAALGVYIAGSVFALASLSEIVDVERVAGHADLDRLDRLAEE